MKKITSKLSLIVVAIALLFSSCMFKDDVGAELTGGTIVGETEVFLGKPDNINYHTKITKKGMEDALQVFEKNRILGQLLSAQYGLRGGKNGDMPGPHAYQYQFNLQTDNYAGYLCLPQDFGGRMQSTYYDSEDFNGGALGSFMQVKNAIVPILNHPQIDSIPEIKSIALLIYNYSAQEVTDVYGALPYVDYKNNVQASPFEYNSAELIYKTIVNNIDTIVACLNHFQQRPEWYKGNVLEILQQNDHISNLSTNDIGSWVKFANSLKLRMAMYIAKVEPELARKWAEEAVASGVIETIDEQFLLSQEVTGRAHPLVDISVLWNDTRLNASFETMLKAYEHPFLNFIFSKNSHDLVNKKDPKKFLPKETKIVGIRSGIRMMPGQSYDVNFRTAYSRIKPNSMENMPLYIMKLSEVQFLRAEGALRGWNMGGTAEEFYTQGIKNAFKQAGLTSVDEDWNTFSFEEIYDKYLSSYLNLENPKKVVYEDPYNERYNLQGLTTVGVKWNESDELETKLEKIITQKYIASFPYSYGAWTDIRRTGYPKIFPVLHDDGDGTIATGDIIRRVPFPGADAATLNDIATTGLDALGGQDAQGTHIWWDVVRPNF